jgi:hypothetical protein
MTIKIEAAQRLKAAKDELGSLPKFPKFSSSKMHKVVDPFWKITKDYDLIRKPENTKGFIGVDGKTALSLIKKGNKFKAGSHITSSLQDAMYWAISYGAIDPKGAVVYALDTKGIKLAEGDQADNANHAVLTKPCVGKPMYFMDHEACKAAEEKF